MSQFFEILIFSQDNWGNVRYVPEINLLRNLISSFPDKSLYLSKKNNLKSEARFCRRKTAEGNNVKNKRFPEYTL